MKPSPQRSANSNAAPAGDHSQDAAALAAKNARPAWETRQPAQVTKGDVEQARAKPGQVTPPGQMGESQGAAS